jgi:hypothetical protein
MRPCCVSQELARSVDVAEHAIRKRTDDTHRLAHTPNQATRLGPNGYNLRRVLTASEAADGWLVEDDTGASLDHERIGRSKVDGDVCT